MSEHVEIDEVSDRNFVEIFKIATKKTRILSLHNAVTVIRSAKSVASPTARPPSTMYSTPSGGGLRAGPVQKHVGTSLGKAGISTRPKPCNLSSSLARLARLH